MLTYIQQRQAAIRLLRLTCSAFIEEKTRDGRLGEESAVRLSVELASLLDYYETNGVPPQPVDESKGEGAPPRESIRFGRRVR